MLNSLLTLAPILLAINHPTPCRRLEVCLSPGCVADGASEALCRLRALAPLDSFSVEPGKCASACGAGPVVIEPSDKANVPTIVHKNVKGVALVKLLEADGVEVDPKIVDGYELAMQGKAAMTEKDNKKAARLLEEGISTAFDSVAGQSSEAATAECSAAVAPHAEWILAAYCNLAAVRLKISDKYGALEAAHNACELSRSIDPLSLETMAEVCAAKKDDVGELDALRKIFALPQEDDPPRDVALRRRSQSFRLARLESLTGTG